MVIRHEYFHTECEYHSANKGINQSPHQSGYSIVAEGIDKRKDKRRADTVLNTGQIDI